MIRRAQRVLVARYEVDADVALRMLVRMSLRTGTRLGEVAQLIVDGYSTGPRSRPHG